MVSPMIYRKDTLFSSVDTDCVYDYRLNFISTQLFHTTMDEFKFQSQSSFSNISLNEIPQIPELFRISITQIPSQKSYGFIQSLSEFVFAVFHVEHAICLLFEQSNMLIKPARCSFS